MTTKTPRTAKAAAVSGTPSFRLECMTLLAASLEHELAAANEKWDQLFQHSQENAAEPAAVKLERKP